MSLRARTSVSDLWLANKVTWKEWLWMNERCWLGLLDGELLWSVVRCCSCSPIQSVIYADLDTRVWGRLVPRVCCAFLSLPPPLIQWDTPRRPLWLFAVYCRVYTVSDVFSTTSVLCGLRRRQWTRRPHNYSMHNIGGWRQMISRVQHPINSGFITA